MTLKTSSNGKKFITSHEGEVLYVYLDPVGLPTVGVGHLVKPDEKDKYPVGKKITRAESQALLADDLSRFERCINREVLVGLEQNEFDALVSFAFNVGEGNFKKSSVLKNLNRGNRSKAADSLLLWNKSKGKVLAGLTRRRKEERALFLTPSAAAPAIQDLPANEDDDSNPSPESASKPSEQQQNLLDRATAPLIAVKSKFDTLGVNPGDISKSSAVTTILTKIGGWLVVLAGFVADRPVWFGIGAVLIVVAVLYLASAKRNATARVVNGVK